MVSFPSSGRGCCLPYGNIFLFVGRDARYTGTEKILYLLYLKRYDLIILLISVFHTLLFRSAPVGGSASQIAAQPVNMTK